MQSDPAHGRDDEIVEKMAAAIFKARVRSYDSSYGDLFPRTKEVYRAEAIAALSVARREIREECAAKADFVAMKAKLQYQHASEAGQPERANHWISCKEGATEAAAAIRAME